MIGRCCCAEALALLFLWKASSEGMQWSTVKPNVASIPTRGNSLLDRDMYVVIHYSKPYILGQHQESW